MFLYLLYLYNHTKFVSGECTLLRQWSKNKKKQCVGRWVFCGVRCTVDSKDKKQSQRFFSIEVSQVTSGNILTENLGMALAYFYHCRLLRND